jgi:hypothetical protein
LSVFFNLYSTGSFTSNFAFDYGLAIDGTSLSFGDGGTARYVQNTTSTYALSSNGYILGTNGISGLMPLQIPLYIPPSSTNLQITLANASGALSPVSSVTPGYSTYSLTTSGTSNTSNFVPRSAFTTSGTYTVPTTCTGGAVSGVYIYCWGSGGTPQGGPTYGGAGAGGFVSGYYGIASGTVLRYVVGIPDSAGNPNTGGGGIGNGNGGGAFSGVFLSNASGIVQSNALIVAGGGGEAMNSGVTSAGSGGAGASQTIATGTGFSGGDGYIYGVGTNTTIRGGSLTAGGVGNNGSGSALTGGGTSGIQGAGGGGGYFGGGAGINGSPNSNIYGGGGSSFASNVIASATFIGGPQITTLGQATTAVPPGGSTSPYYYNPVGSNFGCGGWTTYNPSTVFQGLVVIVPAVGQAPTYVGVTAKMLAT